MSRIHILGADEEKQYRTVVHVAVPTGNNSAGESWKDVFISAGLNVTTLTIGTAPGNITQVENDAIVAGDTLELATTVLAESGGTTTAELKASVDEIVDSFIVDETARLKRVYKYYGHTQEDQ